MSDRRLNRPEIDLLLSLVTRGGIGNPISLPKKHRAIVAPLWRRRIVDIWYRQSPEDGPSFLGSFGALTVSGAKLALAIHEKRMSFNSAPREFSGAGDLS